MGRGPKVWACIAEGSQRSGGLQWEPRAGACALGVRLPARREVWAICGEGSGPVAGQSSRRRRRRLKGDLEARHESKGVGCLRGPSREKEASVEGEWRNVRGWHGRASRQLKAGWGVLLGSCCWGQN